jgi:hypothetical protein
MKRITTATSRDLSHGRRDLFRALPVGAVALITGATPSVDAGAVGATTGANTSVNAGIHAFKLYTGPDSRSHVLEGTIDQMDRTDVVALHF